MKNVFLIAAAFLMGISFAWSETMYSWVDHNGVKRFGDTPPADAQQLKEMGAYKYDREKDMAQQQQFMQQTMIENETRQQQIEMMSQQSLRQEDMSQSNNGYIQDPQVNIEARIQELENEKTIAMKKALSRSGGRKSGIEREAEVRDKYNQKIFNIKQKGSETKAPIQTQGENYQNQIINMRVQAEEAESRARFDQIEAENKIRALEQEARRQEQLQRQQQIKNSHNNLWN